MGNIACIIAVRTCPGKIGKVIRKDRLKRLMFVIFPTILMTGLNVLNESAVAQVTLGPGGEALYDQPCAKCHTVQIECAPNRRVIRKLPAKFMLHSWRAVDPDQDGKMVWQRRVGKDGFAGGIQWGPATESQRVYVARFGIGSTTERDGDTGFSQTLDESVGGMSVNDITTRQQRWHVSPRGRGDRSRCIPADSVALSAIRCLVFSGSVDGYLRAYSTLDRTVVWESDAKGECETRNGVKTRGGLFDSAGPTIVDGMQYLQAGYRFIGVPGGNLLVAFRMDDE